MWVFAFFSQFFTWWVCISPHALTHFSPFYFSDLWSLLFSIFLQMSDLAESILLHIPSPSYSTFFNTFSSSSFIFSLPFSTFLNMLCKFSHHFLYKVRCLRSSQHTCFSLHFVNHFQMFHTAMGNAPQVHTQGLKAAVTKKFTESLWVAAHKQEEREGNASLSLFHT